MVENKNLRHLYISLIWLLSIILGSGSLYAQNNSIKDSVFIEEVKTYAKLKKYQAATKITLLTKDDILKSGTDGLAQLLMKTSSIYVKSNAGSLSTIHFRGTSPTQTSIFFGGLDINSLTLGQSNLSNISTFLFDYVEIQYGSSSTVNGSGSIGGAIHLGLDSLWCKGFKIGLKVSGGSYDEQFYGGKIFYGDGKLQSISKIYYYYHRNDFSFLNKYTEDIENPGAVKDYQHGTSLENYGFIQQFNFKFNSDEYLKSSFWYEHDYHQIQLRMSSNYVYDGEDINVLDDENIRFWSEYHNDKNKIKFTAGIGYVHDKEVENNYENEGIKTDRFVVTSEISNDFKPNFGYKAGLKYKIIFPDVYAYSDSIIDYEQHLDIYASCFWHIKNRWKVTANLRQSFVTDFSVPFTPSAGFEYRALSSSTSSLLIIASIAKSYRVPTLNDRYWGTDGYSDLHPEDGMNYESGINYNLVLNSTKLNIKLNFFYMDIKNWIEWRIDGDLEAENVGEVVSKGIELNSFAENTYGPFNLKLNLNYTFNPCKTVDDVVESNVTGYQLEYTPKHMGNVSLTGKYKEMECFIQSQYTGERITDGTGDTLDSYFLVNTGFMYNLHIKSKIVRISFSLNNLLNRNYQNEKYYAMPLRTFRVSAYLNL